MASFLYYQGHCSSDKSSFNHTRLKSCINYTVSSNHPRSTTKHLQTTKTPLKSDMYPSRTRTSANRESMSSTVPLLSHQEKPARQSSRAQGAQRFRETPHGEFVTTKRQGFKKLLTHPKQFLGEAIGAGYEEMSQKKAEEENYRERQERGHGWRREKIRRASMEEKNEHEASNVYQQGPPTWFNAPRAVQEQAVPVQQRTSRHVPQESNVMSDRVYTPRSAPTPLPTPTPVAAPASPRPVAAPRPATPFRPLAASPTTSPAIPAAAVPVAQQPLRRPPPPPLPISSTTSRAVSAAVSESQQALRRPPPPPPVLQPNPARANQQIIPKAPPMPPSQTSPVASQPMQIQTQAPPVAASNVIPPAPPMPTPHQAPLRRKSAMKSKESQELRQKRSVTFEDVLAEVRTFKKDDEPKSIPKAPSYEGSR